MGMERAILFEGFANALVDIVPVDRPLRFFHARRAIALFGIVPVDRPLRFFHARRAIALFASKGRSPFYTV